MYGSPGAAKLTSKLCSTCCHRGLSTRPTFPSDLPEPQGDSRHCLQTDHFGIVMDRDGRAHRAARRPKILGRIIEVRIYYPDPLERSWYDKKSR